MKRFKTSVLLLSLALGTMFVSCSAEAKIEPKAYNDGIHVIPQPVEVTQTADGLYTLSKNTSFVVSGEGLTPVAEFFAGKIGTATGYDIKVKDASSDPRSEIALSLVGTDVVPQEEGYTLEVTTDGGIKIQASTPRGAFWGMRTLMQLLPAEIESPKAIKGMAWTMPLVSIVDYPRFAWRGQHVDVSRHFLPKEEILKTIDLLSMLKINKLHFHLVDDQGWRIEIKKYPRLTAEGATRTEGEGTTYGPFFYTQEEIKEIVAYADERFVEVIPEIELPGHSAAAVTAYPDLGCNGPDFPYEVRNIWGISTEIYSATNPRVFTFLKDVIDEVVPLFHTDYFHIGGDEADKRNWDADPKVHAFMKEKGIKDVHELQSWFIKQIEPYIVAKGKKMIGWEEILEGGLAPSAAVMSWTGEAGGIKSANMGHDVVLTPASHGLYLDHYQGDPNVEPLAIGGYSTIDKVYAYDPMPEEIAPENRHHVLGVQANLWAEYFYTPEQYEYMAQPRVAALAEIAWSPLEVKDFTSFLKRLDNWQARLDQIGWNYFIPQPEQGAEPRLNQSIDHVTFVGESIEMPFSTVYPVDKIIYTTDGTDPDVALDSVGVYADPLTFTASTTLKIRSVNASGRMSPVRTIEVVKADGYAPAVAEMSAELQKGLMVGRFDRQFKNSDELLAAPADSLKYAPAAKDPKGKSSIMIANRAPMYKNPTSDHVMSNLLYSGMIYEGYIDVPEDGVYRFSTTNNRLWIDDKEVINNDELPKKSPRTDVTLALAKGLHSIKWTVVSEVRGGWPTGWSDGLVYWGRFDKDERLSPIPDDAFYRK